MAQSIDNFRQLWERTSLIQRVVLVAIVLACGCAAALLVGWARKPHMAMLYSGLSQEDAAKVVDKVRDAGVQYELTAGGSTVNVPAEKVYSVRLTMASAGLPEGQLKGYRILDESKIGTSPFKERINYIRAVEGELAMTIQLLDGVSKARVHIVKPEVTLFAGQKNASSATVALRTQPGWRLTPSNIAAIVHLVAGSVEGLIPEKVVVVNSRGELLSGEDSNDELAGKAGSFLDYKSRVEDYLAGKAEDMLAAALGPNRASVRVDAVIETTRIDETTETYDPDKRVATKEEVKTSKSTPVGAAAGDVKGGTKTTEENTVSEYKVSRTVQQKTNLPGKVQSLTVAVFVDLSPPPKPEDTEGDAPAATLKIEDVEDIIRNAIGLKSTDTLKVVSTTFPQTAAQTIQLSEEDGGMFTAAFLLDMARQFSLGILVIGALLLLRIFRGSKKASSKNAPALEGQDPTLALAGPDAGINLLPGGSPQANAELLKSQITKALQENPEEVKRLFLSWVNSGKGGM